MIFEGVDGLLCDLDGVVYRGDEGIPGAAETVERLRARGVKIVFCTNNSNSTVEQYVEKLARLGVESAAEDILTSAVVTAEALAERGFSGKKAIVIGGEGIRQSLASIDVAIDDDPESTESDAVVVGLDEAFDYDAMRRASLAVRRGAAFFATNDDASLPRNEELWPGAGAIIASIATATGRSAEVMGKPHPPMMEAAAKRLHGATRIAVVGDRPETDLKGARRQGWMTILALSGVTARDGVDSLDFEPDATIDSLAELVSGEDQ